jgi:REP element-mobilizing transposase RayT
MPHSYTNLLYHIVFATKDRTALIKPDLAPKIHAYLATIIRDVGGDTLIVNGSTDHVHILATLKQDQALSQILRKLKANSSKWINDTLSPDIRFAWQTGYGAFTVSESQLERVHTYIENQEKHHQRTTFEEEFQALLKTHNINFKPEYLWT